MSFLNQQTNPISSIPASPVWVEFAIGITNPNFIQDHLQRVKNGQIKGPSGGELLVQFMRKSDGIETVDLKDAQPIPSYAPPSIPNSTTHLHYLRVATSIASHLVASLDDLEELLPPQAITSLLFCCNNMGAVPLNPLWQGDNLRNIWVLKMFSNLQYMDSLNSIVTSTSPWIEEQSKASYVELQKIEKSFECLYEMGVYNFHKGLYQEAKKLFTQSKELFDANLNKNDKLLNVEGFILACEGTSTGAIIENTSKAPSLKRKRDNNEILSNAKRTRNSPSPPTMSLEIVKNMDEYDCHATWFKNILIQCDWKSFALVNVKSFPSTSIDKSMYNIVVSFSEIHSKYINLQKEIMSNSNSSKITEQIDFIFKRLFILVKLLWNFNSEQQKIISSLEFELLYDGIISSSFLFPMISNLVTISLSKFDSRFPRYEGNLFTNKLYEVDSVNIFEDLKDNFKPFCKSVMSLSEVQSPVLNFLNDYYESQILKNANESNLYYGLGITLLSQSLISDNKLEKKSLASQALKNLLLGGGIRTNFFVGLATDGGVKANLPKYVLEGVLHCLLILEQVFEAAAVSQYAFNLSSAVEELISNPKADFNMEFLDYIWSINVLESIMHIHCNIINDASNNIFQTQAVVKNISTLLSLPSVNEWSGSIVNHSKKERLSLKLFQSLSYRYVKNKL